MSQSKGDKFARLIFEANEAIEDRYGPDATVGSLLLVADVIAVGDDKTTNPIIIYSNDARKWLQLALLEQGLAVAQDAEDARIAEAED